MLLALLAGALGCQCEPSIEFAPVEGTVTIEGRPLPGVIVVYWGDPEASIKAPLSSGMTDGTGHYRLHTDQGVEGAVVGRHRVCIVEAAALPSFNSFGRAGQNDKSKAPPAPVSSIVPPHYSRPNETPLHADVRSGAQVINFEVK
jgi:hypothetical protein